MYAYIYIYIYNQLFAGLHGRLVADDDDLLYYTILQHTITHYNILYDIYIYIYIYTHIYIYIYISLSLCLTIPYHTILYYAVIQYSSIIH